MKKEEFFPFLKLKVLFLIRKRENWFCIVLLKIEKYDIMLVNLEYLPCLSGLTGGVIVLIMLYPMDLGMKVSRSNFSF